MPRNDDAAGLERLARHWGTLVVWYVRLVGVSCYTHFALAVLTWDIFGIWDNRDHPSCVITINRVAVGHVGDVSLSLLRSAYSYFLALL